MATKEISNTNDKSSYSITSELNKKSYLTRKRIILNLNEHLKVQFDSWLKQINNIKNTEQFAIDVLLLTDLIKNIEKNINAISVADNYSFSTCFDVGRIIDSLDIINRKCYDSNLEFLDYSNTADTDKELFADSYITFEIIESYIGTLFKLV